MSETTMTAGPETVAETRKRAGAAGLCFWWVRKDTGKKGFVPKATLEGWLASPSEWMRDRGQVAEYARRVGLEAEGRGEDETGEAVPVTDESRAPEAAKPVAVKPAGVAPSNGSAGASLEAAIRAIAAGAAGVDVGQVEAIVDRAIGDQLVKLHDEVGRDVDARVKSSREAIESKVSGMISAAVAKAIESMPARDVRVHAVTAPEAHTIKGPLPKVFDRLVKLASIRQNVLMVGPAGCGKTFLAGKVAEALGLSYAFVSCSAGMSEGQVAGRLLPIEAGGRFVYVPAPFVTAYEGGGAFLFDELDSADANTMTFLNAALANGHLALPHRPEKPIATRHKDFVCLAAANTFGHGANRVYAGRNQLDGATLDRFRAGIVAVEYDPGVEKALVDAEVLAWGLKIREAISAPPGLRRIMSTRALIDFSKQKQLLKLGRADWEESYFADWSADDRAKVGR